MKIIFYSILSAAMLYGCRDKSGKPDGSGRFEAEEVVVSAEVSGKITDLIIEEGMHLNEGEVVGLTDTMQLYFQKMRLLAGGEAVRFRRADVSKQIGVLEQQRENLKRERERSAKLFSLNAGDKKSLDEIDYQISTVDRQIDAQRSALERGNLSVDKESSAIEIQVAQTEDLIYKSIIRAPIKGTVLTKYASKGEFKAVGQPLFRIADTDNMIFRAYVSYNQLLNISIGTKAQIFTGIKDSEKIYEGEVIWISQEAEFTPKNVLNSEERSNLVYAVKIGVKSDGYLKSGMYGDFKFLKRDVE